MRLFPFLFILYPFAEIFSLIALSKLIGGLWALLLVGIFCCLGIGMLYTQTWGKVVISLLRQTWRSPSPAPFGWYNLIWPLRYVLVGLCFAIPGVLNSLLGLLLLLLLKAPQAKDPGGAHTNTHYHEAIEGEYVEVSNKKHPPLK